MMDQTKYGGYSGFDIVFPATFWGGSVSIHWCCIDTEAVFTVQDSKLVARNMRKRKLDQFMLIQREHCRNILLPADAYTKTNWLIVFNLVITSLFRDDDCFTE